jgi:putative hydrolase of the HAD superfamily
MNGAGRRRRSLSRSRRHEVSGGMKGKVPIRAVTFDVGGTLIRPWPSVGHIYSQVAARHGGPAANPEELSRRFMEVWRGQKRFDYSREAWFEVVRRTFGVGWTVSRLRPVFEEIYERFEQASAWQIYDDVEPTLDRLGAAGFKLGIISNWDERLRPLLKRLKLDRYFATIVASHELGLVKPVAAMFLRTAERLGEKPAALLHVGDGWREDHEGAKAAGCRSFYLNREDEEAEEEGKTLTRNARSAEAIRSLNELADVLEETG